MANRDRDKSMQPVQDQAVPGDLAVAAEQDSHPSITTTSHKRPGDDTEDPLPFLRMLSLLATLAALLAFALAIGICWKKPDTIECGNIHSWIDQIPRPWPPRPAPTPAPVPKPPTENQIPLSDFIVTHDSLGIVVHNSVDVLKEHYKLDKAPPSLDILAVRLAHSNLPGRATLSKRVRGVSARANTVSRQLYEFGLYIRKSLSSTSARADMILYLLEAEVDRTSSSPAPNAKYCADLSGGLKKVDPRAAGYVHSICLTVSALWPTPSKPPIDPSGSLTAQLDDHLIEMDKELVKLSDEALRVQNNLKSLKVDVHLLAGDALKLEEITRAKEEDERKKEEEKKQSNVFSWLWVATAEEGPSGTKVNLYLEKNLDTLRELTDSMENGSKLISKAQQKVSDMRDAINSAKGKSGEGLVLAQGYTKNSAQLWAFTLSFKGAVDKLKTALEITKAKWEQINDGH